ncbi:hypothetical protein SAMN05216383_10642 [Prevotella sp. KH2C16]|nr:hypothetical protein SAMN05216383_10642 [Prevotella sp. KH2C16]
MKTRVLFAMMACLFAGLLTGCSDDEEIDIHMLDGKWEKVYDADEVAEGSVEYEFQAREYVQGTFTGTIFVHDIAAGDTTIPFRWLYGSSLASQKELYIEYENDSGQTERDSYFVAVLTKHACRLVSTETDKQGNHVKVINLRRIK